MLVKHWNFGDRVVHAGRPEWGVGVVTGAIGETVAGKACQKLTIRFERSGLKTISTAHADLRPESDLPMLAARDRHEPEHDPLKLGDGPSARDLMLKLPDQATDPFITPRQRLDNTLALYRFSDQGGSLLDWAAMQSGLKDPMSRFNRHELEELFRRWTQVRDEHLRRLVVELKKSDPGLLTQAARTAPKPALIVLRRLDAVR